VLKKLKEGFKKSRNFITNGIENLFSGKKIEQSTYEQLEELLISADFGVNITSRLIEGVEKKIKRIGSNTPESVKTCLKEEILDILSIKERPLNIVNGLSVIMVIGVNGVGKTTTIGKLAFRFKNMGKKVILSAADTFRAAAIEQLIILGDRIGVPVIKQSAGSDPAAVVFDSLHASLSRGADILIIDTAGRLHTKINLMEELKKINRVIKREISDAPHEIFLILDATTGQNAIFQASMFNEALGVTGIILAKMDGTSKGGIVVDIVNRLNIPVRYIGIGEGIEDLVDFNQKDFLDAIFD
jgi:fused signal recognition particle receptor